MISRCFKSLLLLVMIYPMLPTKNLNAQGFMGFHSDNYSGVHALQWNPALLVDNRLAFQMNLSANHFTVTNNYIGINAPTFLGDIDGAINNSNFVDDYLTERLNGKEKSGLVRANYTLPLSFMVSFGKKKES